jgi:hypothetical protein
MRRCAPRWLSARYVSQRFSTISAPIASFLHVGIFTRLLIIAFAEYSARRLRNHPRAARDAVQAAARIAAEVRPIAQRAHGMCRLLLAQVAFVLRPTPQTPLVAELIDSGQLRKCAMKPLDLNYGNAVHQRVRTLKTTERIAKGTDFACLE